MNCALLIGKKNSSGLPGKNVMKILGRPMVEYSLMAASHSRFIDAIYVSTDCPEIKRIASLYGAKIISREEELCQGDTPTEHVFRHGYDFICRDSGRPKMISLMFANSPDVTSMLLDEGFSMLEKNEEVDAVVSVSKFNMFSPMRARKVDEKGLTEPLLDIESIANSFDRDAMGDIYYCDFGVQVVRPERCLEEGSVNAAPFRWLGKTQLAMKRDIGFDVDFKWQVPVVEMWLSENGFTVDETPYD